MIAVDQRYVVASDGTRIGYQVRGEGPCVVLANGLGGTYLVFRALYDARYGDVLDGYKVICWDYRGLYTSSAPADPRANTVAHHVADLMAILDAERAGDFVLAGWSMGVQVGFEAIRCHPDRVKGMFAINGTHGRTFRTVMGSRLVGKIVPMLWRLVKAQAWFARRATATVVTRAAALDALIGAMKRVGLAAQSIDMATFRAVVAGFRRVDWAIYSDLMARLDEHDAEVVLETIAIPFAIVTGDRDLMTPATTADAIHRAVRGSRLVVARGGTHYTPVEFPELIADELGRLLDRVPGWERRGVAA